MQGRPFIIGVGNTLRGDDGAGQVVADLLWLQRDRFSVLSGAGFALVHQLTPELAVDISQASIAVFIDAALDGQPAGSVSTVSLGPAVPVAGGGDPGFGSGCWESPTPSGLLALANRLYGRAPRAVLVSVSVSDCTVGAVLSPLVRVAVGVAAMAVRLAIQACYGDVGPVGADLGARP